MKETKFSSFRLSLDEKLVGNVEIVGNTQKETEQEVETPSGEGVNRRIADLRRLVLNRGKLQQRFSEQIDREQFKPQSQSQPPSRKVSYVQTHNLQRQHLIKSILSDNKPIDLLNPQHSEIMLEVLKKAIRNKEEISLIQLFLTNSSVMQLDPNGTLSVSDLAAQIYPFVSYSFAPKDSTIYTAGQFALHCYTVVKGSVGQISEDDFKVMTLAALSKPKIQEFQCSSPKSFSANKKNIKFAWGKQETEQLLSPEPTEVQYQKIFKEGQSFGDVEIITNQTRSTTTVSLEDTHLIMISKEGFELVLAKFRKQQVEENINFVKQFSFFQEIPISRLLTLMDSGKTVKFSNKQIIYTEGEEIENIYFITSGEVSLSLIRDNRRINLQIIGANAYFGTDEFSDQSSIRTHRAQSNSNNLSTIVFPLHKLQKFLSFHKQLDRFMADANMKARFRKEIAEKIIQTQNQYQSDSEQSFKKQAEYDKEIRKHIEASRKLAPKLDAHQREEEMKDLRKFETVGKIVNAREQIFTMLDKQRQENSSSSTNNLNRYATKANPSKQRFVSQWEESSSVQQHPSVLGQNQQNKNNQHLIFDASRDLLFGQSYYVSQAKQRSPQPSSSNNNALNNATDPFSQKELESSRKSSGRSSMLADSPIKQSRRLTNKTTNSFSQIKQNISNNPLSTEVMGLVNPIREFFQKNDINIYNLGKKLGTRLEERLMGKEKQNKNGKQEENTQLDENSKEKEDLREIKTSEIIDGVIDRNEEANNNKGRREILTASSQHRNLSRRHLLGIKQGDVWSRKDAILDNSNSLYMNNASLRNYNNNNNNNNSSYNNINIQTYSANAISSASAKNQRAHFHLRRDTSIDILQDKSQQNLLINSFRTIEKEPAGQSPVNPQNPIESPANRNRNYHSTSYGLVPFQTGLTSEKSFNIGSPGSNTPKSTGSGSGGSTSLCQGDKKLHRKNSTFSKAIENSNKTNQKTTSNLLSQYFPSSFQIQAKQEMDSFEKTDNKTPEQLPLLNCNSYDLIHNEINRFPLSLQKKFKLNKIEKLQKERALLSNSSDHILQQPNTKRATNQLS